ncbi:MAG: D-alanyl-D-alanine carboxypeptidase/D-alanyl-D-alanine endopeptidase [Sulfuriferula sp.]
MQLLKFKSLCAMHKTLLKLLLCLCLSWNAVHAATLPLSVTTALSLADIPLQHVGIIVWDDDQSQARLRINPLRPFNPASTMKLVTSYAALSLLGPAYTWQTLVATDGTLHDGILDGNLYLKGDGDPSLTPERFWMLLHQLRLSGLRRINGDLIIDQSQFQLDPASDFDDQPHRAYNALPAATMVNFNSNTVYLKLENNQLRLSAEPLPPNTRLINRISLDDAPCSQWRERIHIDWNASERLLTLSGAYPKACGDRSLSITLGDASELVADFFTTLWAGEGGVLKGTAHTGIMPLSAVPLLNFASEPLALTLYNQNKFSNNVMARNLFLSLSPDIPAHTQAAAQQLQTWLTQQNLNFPELVMENGAGLSRLGRISPESMAQLLRSAYRSPVYAEFATTLPIVAVDGTMKKRDRNDMVAGHAHIKTGTLDGIKTMAGYVTLPNGHTTVVVFFIDDPHAAAGTAAQDALLDWVYQTNNK